MFGIGIHRAPDHPRHRGRALRRASAPGARLRRGQGDQELQDRPLGQGRDRRDARRRKKVARGQAGADPEPRAARRRREPRRRRRAALGERRPALRNGSSRKRSAAGGTALTHRLERERSAPAGSSSAASARPPCELARLRAPTGRFAQLALAASTDPRAASSDPAAAPPSRRAAARRRAHRAPRRCASGSRAARRRRRAGRRPRSRPSGPRSPCASSSARCWPAELRLRVGSAAPGASVEGHERKQRRGHAPRRSRGRCARSRRADARARGGRSTLRSTAAALPRRAARRDAAPRRSALRSRAPPQPRPAARRPRADPSSRGFPILVLGVVPRRGGARAVSGVERDSEARSRTAAACARGRARSSRSSIASRAASGASRRFVGGGRVAALKGASLNSQSLSLARSSPGLDGRRRTRGSSSVRRPRSARQSRSARAGGVLVGASCARSIDASAARRPGGSTKKACLQREQRTRTPPAGTWRRRAGSCVAHCSQVTINGALVPRPRGALC